MSTQWRTGTNQHETDSFQYLQIMNFSIFIHFHFLFFLENPTKIRNSTWASLFNELQLLRQVKQLAWFSLVLLHYLCWNDRFGSNLNKNSWKLEAKQTETDIPDFSFKGKSCARNVNIRPEKTVFCIFDKRFSRSKWVSCHILCQQ